MSRRPGRHRNITAPQAVRDELSALAHELGIRSAARFIGISREALMGATAGMPILAGTLALIQIALASRKGMNAGTRHAR